MKITKPTLLVDKNKCLQNIERVAKKAKAAGVTLRPHFKTHHSDEIGNWYRDFGVETCTASSVSMAKYFAENGWDDITIAFPYNPLESEVINEIAKKSRINILIESMESLQLANKLLTGQHDYYLKIDVGTHRTGIDPANRKKIEELVNGSDDRIQFKGFLGHAGHTYGCRDQACIKEIYDSSVALLTPLKENYGGIISFGDTPSSSVVEDFSAVDEIRAGNYIFYDWMQHKIGSCRIEDIAVCLACPVVAIHEDRNEVVVFGGAVHLSKDSVLENELPTFGKAVSLNNHHWNAEVIGNVRKISQEHGVITMNENQLAHVKVGDLIGILPVHSCLTADLQGHYFTTEGQRIEKIIKE